MNWQSVASLILAVTAVTVAALTFRSSNRLEGYLHRMEERDLTARRQAARMAVVYFQALACALQPMSVPNWASSWNAELQSLPPCRLRQELANVLPKVIQIASNAPMPAASVLTQQRSDIKQWISVVHQEFDATLTLIDSWNGKARE